MNTISLFLLGVAFILGVLRLSIGPADWDKATAGGLVALVVYIALKAG